MRVTFIPLLLALAAVAAGSGVRVDELPERGVQPQVVVDAAGTAHVIYLKGEPAGCDVRHARRSRGERAWSAPATINSEPGTAVALGSIRGAQVALGVGGVLHVLWNGPARAGGDSRAAPLFYSRFTPGDAPREPQRDLRGQTTALDGGASVASDGRGRVFIVWHGRPHGAVEGEAGRAVFVRRSDDDGRSFSEPVIANADFPGTCACCSLKSLVRREGDLLTLYRAAHTGAERDVTLLTSRDGAATFTRMLLDPWKTATCPMSSAALVETGAGVRGAWETEGRIRSALLGSVAAPIDLAAEKAKHPVLATNDRGETLVAWAVGTGWNRGGEVGWMILGADGRPSGERGQAPGIPAWSFPAAYAEADGSFVILR